MAVNTMSTAARAMPAVAAAPEAGSVSAVSWAAVFAGAIGASAVTIVLAELGIGLGFASVSAWPNSGASLATLGVMGGVWLILTQWIASGIGGYLAGRLRTKWTSLHTDEVFFRDTAHGFLAWSLATVISVCMIALVGATALNAGSRVASAVGPGQLQTATSPSGAQSAAPGATQDQAAPFSPASDTTRQTAEQARKGAAFGAIATALAMLVGAFIACVTAALGGRLRDEY